MQALADETIVRSRRSLGVKTRLSRIRALMLTALGLPRGFFIQYRYIDHLQPVGEPYPEVERVCAESGYRDFISEMEGHKGTFMSFGASPTDPELAAGMFPALDGMACYTAVRKFKPKRIVEIGSGNSTRFLARGVKDNGFGQITCIDPEPRRAIIDLDVDFKPRLMNNADAELAGSLEANDILFIDSSHIMLPGMDVDIQFNRLFPRLKPGVIVHVHDIFLPDDYPPHWKIRNYSEQNALMGWLLGGAFELVWPSQFVVTRHRSLLENLAEVKPLEQGGSMWLRRV